MGRLALEEHFLSEILPLQNVRTPTARQNPGVYIAACTRVSADYLHEIEVL